MLLEYWNAAPVASVIFIFTLVTSIYAFNNTEIFGKFMLHPYSVAKGSKLYTFITSGLIHADWMHLIFNMVAFYSFGFALEVMIGSWKFGLIYFISLILSDVPTVLRHKDDYRYNSLGASGAISGVIFSFILFQPLSKLGIIFIPFVQVYAIVFGVLYLIYCMYMSKNSRDSINHDAHFFGALTGLIITVFLKPGIIPHFISELSRIWQ